MNHEEKIRADLEAVKAKGYKIVCRGFGSDDDKTCCALTAVAIEAGWTPELNEKGTSRLELAIAVLDVNLGWARKFIEGFDNRYCEIVGDATSLGTKLREEYIKD